MEVHVVASGLFKSVFSAVLAQNASVPQVVIGQTPLGRHGQPDDLVGAAIFPTSRAVDLIADHFLLVDGGGRM